MKYNIAKYVFAATLRKVMGKRKTITLAAVGSKSSKKAVVNELAEQKDLDVVIEKDEKALLFLQTL
jgi:hypothetical protein